MLESDGINHRWGSGASAMHFSEHFIKQKLQSTPNLVAMGHLFGPKVWIWKLTPGAMVPYFQGKCIISKLDVLGTWSGSSQ